MDLSIQGLNQPQVWRHLTAKNPCGLHWRHASARTVKEIIQRLRSFLTETGIFVDADGEDRELDEPKNLIVLYAGQTDLIPLRFRDHVVYVGGVPVAVAHDGGVLLLAQAIVNAIQKILYLQTQAQCAE